MNMTWACHACRGVSNGKVAQILAGAVFRHIKQTRIELSVLGLNSQYSLLFIMESRLLMYFSFPLCFSSGNEALLIFRPL